MIEDLSVGDFLTSGYFADMLSFVCWNRIMRLKPSWATLHLLEHVHRSQRKSSCHITRKPPNVFLLRQRNGWWGVQRRHLYSCFGEVDTFSCQLTFRWRIPVQTSSPVNDWHMTLEPLLNKETLDLTGMRFQISLKALHGYKLKRPT